MMDIKIPPTYWPELEARVVKSNRKANVLGVDPMTLTFTGIVEEVIPDPEHPTDPAFNRVARYATGTLVGNAPTLNGWTFVAALDHTPAGNVVRRFNRDAAIPADWKTRPSTCDHCESQRRRKTTFILVDADGAMKQVGSTCLKDFMGFNASPESLVRMAETIHSFSTEDFMDHAPHGELGDPTDWVLMNALAVIRKAGFFRSAAKAEETGKPSTRAMVDSNMALLRSRDQKDRDAATRPSIKDMEDAKAVVAWAATIDGSTEFEANVKTILSMRGVSGRHFGLAVAAAWSWMKATGNAPEYTPKVRPCEPSVWMGNVKDKITDVKAAVAMIREMDTDWGRSMLVKMVTDDGNAVAWFTGTAPDVKEGDKVMILRATIKSLKEWQGIKETQVTRAKVALVERPMAAPLPESPDAWVVK